MSTVIRDINGNRVKKTIRHYLNNAPTYPGLWHQDSTGLYCCDYEDSKGGQFCAFIRIETPAEHQAVAIAKKLGTKRT